MQHDEVIWQCINQHFCSFKVKTERQNFCRNRYNITGLCQRGVCPLANSRYATILEEKGKCILHIKTIERAHAPSELWEKIELPENHQKALAKIDKHLMYWPSYLINRVKQRLSKIQTYLRRMRKLKLKTVRTKLVTVNKKIERMEARREVKALRAAKITEKIQEELINRLQQGTYGEIYNFPQQQYDQVLDGLQESEATEEVPRLTTERKGSSSAAAGGDDSDSSDDGNEEELNEQERAELLELEREFEYEDEEELEMLNEVGLEGGVGRAKRPNLDFSHGVRFVEPSSDSDDDVQTNVAGLADIEDTLGAKKRGREGATGARHVVKRRRTKTKA